MTITLGRVELDHLQSYSRSGDQVSISGQLQGPTEDAARWRAGQLAAYDSNPDEMVVPLIDSSWDEVCGIYVPRSVKVGPVGTPQQGLWKFDATLEQVRDFAAPIVDVACPTIYRTGFAEAESNCFSLYGMPASIASYDLQHTYGSMAAITRQSASGDVIVFVGSGSGQVTSWRYQVAAAADWYDGACVLEATFDGSTWIVWPGFQIPAGITSWRLGNGLVRVTPSATAGRIDVQHFDGTQWETAKTYQLSTSGASSLVEDVGLNVTVLRNAPHVASVRVAAVRSSSNLPVQRTLTLTAKRGDRWLHGRLTRTGASTGGGVRRDSTEAATGTGLDGGISAASDDADGNRYVLASAVATTEDLINGGLSTGSGTAVDFGIGTAIGGVSPPSQEAADDLIRQYGRWVNERPRVATL